MNHDEEREAAHKMITLWACSELHQGMRAKPQKEALAQFTRDKAQAHILKHYAHAFAWIVGIYDRGVLIHESSGRAASAAAMLDCFVAEAQAALLQFGDDKHGSFAPVKA